MKNIPEAKKISFSWKINFNKKTYSPGDNLVCKLSVNNTSSKELRITRYQLIFDWCKTKKEKDECIVDTNTVIPSKKEREIKEKLNIRIPVWVDISHHYWNIILNADVKKDGDWRDLGKPIEIPSYKILIKKANKKYFKIFVSHRICKEDKTLVERIEKLLENNGFTPLIIEKNPQTNPSLWGEIKENIFESHCFLLVWTKNAQKNLEK